MDSRVPVDWSEIKVVWVTVVVVQVILLGVGCSGVSGLGNCWCRGVSPLIRADFLGVCDFTDPRF